jgi:MFS family permease
MSAPDNPAISGPSRLPTESIKRLLPWLVAVAFFMQSHDTTIINTAVPAIARALAVTPLSMKAVLASYTLSLAVFIPISGGWRIALARAGCSRRPLDFLRSDHFSVAFPITFTFSWPAVFCRDAVGP